jgi:hypothetical protein
MAESNGWSGWRVATSIHPKYSCRSRSNRFARQTVVVRSRSSTGESCGYHESNQDRPRSPRYVSPKPSSIRRAPVAALLTLIALISPVTAAESIVLTSTAPAQRWQDARIGGSGIQGVVVHGNPLEETIVVNHEKLWGPSQPGAGRARSDLTCDPGAHGRLSCRWEKK